MLFSYENQEKKFPINFSSPCMRRTNTCNFTNSSWIQNRARRDTGDSRPVTSIQERCFCGFQCFCCAMEENMVLWCVVHNKNTETRESGILALTSQAHYPQFPILRGFVQVYPTENEITRICPPYTRGRKIDREFFFSIFIQEQHEYSIKQIKKSVIYTLKHWIM